MSEKYVLGIDQSTQGTKALLFDSVGRLVERCDFPHRQIINDQGWVSHDGSEIYENIIKLIPRIVEKSGIDKQQIVCVGISNQRETSIVWDKDTGMPIDHAIVWQCARAKNITNQLEQEGYGTLVRERTGIPLSPYFPAAKIAWLLKYVKGAKKKEIEGKLGYGTMDSYLVYRLTKGTSYKTDYSNASRTQLFNLFTLDWDKEICDLFGISLENLPKICDSDSDFGETDFEGYLERKIPILGVLGDSHGALYGQGCHQKGMAKATYGTGSSIMMNIGEKPILSKKGLVTSLAWKLDGTIQYVLEGNLNYTGAVISWLKNDLQLIQSDIDTEKLAMMANPKDTSYLVPAFTGLGAPYWQNDAKAVLVGMSRTTKKAEIAKAALECIAYQITDIMLAMGEDSGIPLVELKVDGGPTKNSYLMQFQSDLLGMPVRVPSVEELSGMGVAYMAGIKKGIYNQEILFESREEKTFFAVMDEETRKEKYQGWKKAVMQCSQKSDRK